MSDYNPTDDELRKLEDNPNYTPQSRDLARLVLREREEYETDLARMNAAFETAEAGRLQARAALDRVEAFASLCTEVTAREIRAAIAGGKPRSPLPPPNPLMAATLDGDPAAPLITGDGPL